MAKKSRTARREAAQRRHGEAWVDPIRADPFADETEAITGPLAALAGLRSRRDELDEDLRGVQRVIGETVIRARRDGSTWLMIGESLGLTGQAAGLIYKRALDVEPAAGT